MLKNSLLLSIARCLSLLAFLAGFQGLLKANDVTIQESHLYYYSPLRKWDWHISILLKNESTRECRLSITTTANWSSGWYLNGSGLPQKSLVLFFKNLPQEQVGDSLTKVGPGGTILVNGLAPSWINLLSFDRISVAVCAAGGDPQNTPSGMNGSSCYLVKDEFQIMLLRLQSGRCYSLFDRVRFDFSYLNKPNLANLHRFDR